MIKILKNILKNQNQIEAKDDNKNLELLCGLMIEAAYTDGQIEEEEINKIKISLINVFEEKPNDVELLLNKAIENKNFSFISFSLMLF